jgi:putative solute:sodium symporter small subunit
MNALGERESGEQTERQLAHQQRRIYWRKTQRLTALLLMIWFGVSFGVSYFARELSFEFFGWPFSFWVASQGALVVYGLIIAFYAWYMGRLDALHGFNEDDEA